MHPQQKKFDEAFEKARFFHKQKKLKEARMFYEKSLKIKPSDLNALSSFGLFLLQQGDLFLGIEYVKKAITIDPNNFGNLFNLGNAYIQAKDFSAAYDFFEKALSIRPGNIDCIIRQGDCLGELKEYDRALEKFHSALLVDNNNFLVYVKKGITYTHAGSMDIAISCFEKARDLNPGFPPTYTWLGTALSAKGQHEDAFFLHDKAVSLDPNYSEAYFNRANSRKAFQNIELVLADYDKALQLNPSYTAAHIQRGLVLQEMRRIDEAIESFKKCIAIDPKNIFSHSHLAHSYASIFEHEKSIESFDKLLDLDPEFPCALGSKINAQNNICDWIDYYKNLEAVSKLMKDNKQVSIPFVFLSLNSSAKDQLMCAKQYIEINQPLSIIKPWDFPVYKHEKIRVAYLSADFHTHATAFLAAGMFESHDKQRFTIYAISFGPDSSESMRARLVNAFDQFVDVRNMCDSDVVSLLRNLEIDIAVDLKGLTAGMRPGIFSHRAAPIQVSYLGYPGTMGAEYIDYIIADKFVIPPEHYDFYTEKVVSLPHTYQVNDRLRNIATTATSRADFGLPENGFVFCCFNNNYKITPFMFDIWMRLLGKIEGSVLWLLECNSQAKQNLIKEAGNRGVSSDRLVFAAKTSLDEHLARHKHADLFLDTLPYNAHTTTSDALWAGLPVVTCMGDGFASRVAGSLLNAIGLPELVTTTLEDYESLALRLAANPQLLSEFKEKLARNRLVEPLFNTALFTKHMESAYETMMDKHRRGELPAHFFVDA